MMGRRIFLTTVARLDAAPRASEAQQAGEVPRIGYLSPLSAFSDSTRIEAFCQELRARGSVEAQDR